MKINHIKYQLTFLLLFWIISPAISQYNTLDKTASANKMQLAIDSIYNLNFEAADVMIAELEKELSEYPGLWLLKAFYVSWKYRPIKDEHKSYRLFESYLTKGIEQSEAMLEKDENDVEANFFLMACHAYLAELYVNNGHSFKALGEAKTSYNYIKVGFDYLDENPEFYFSSGIFNYYREKYPEENPFYKSFLWFFRSGDMVEGLKMLEKGAKTSVFTKAECYTYLFHIYLRYEDKPSKAIYYARLLKDKYPNNLHYIANYIENSFRMDSYDELNPYIRRLMSSDKKYYQYLGEIFYGIYLENSGAQKEVVLEHLTRADKLGEEDEIRMPHYDSILYFSLGKLYLKNGDESQGTKYLKKSIKSAEYSSYRKDAEELLND